jgi:hypothetical protein
MHPTEPVANQLTTCIVATVISNTTPGLVFALAGRRVVAWLAVFAAARVAASDDWFRSRIVHL